MDHPYSEQEVTVKEIEASFAFAEELYEKNAASQKQFGRGDIIRQKNDFIADHVLGKAAEYALCSFLNSYFDIQFEVDLNVWNDPLIHDEGNDLSVLYLNGNPHHLPFKVDIKGTRKHSKWLVVEKHKITNFKTLVYVIVRLVNLPTGKIFENDPYIYRGKPWKARIEGYAWVSDVMEVYSQTGWFEFKKGDRLLNPNILVPIKDEISQVSASEYQKKLSHLLSRTPEEQKYIGPQLDCLMNFGLPHSWLRSSIEEWNDFADILRREVIPVEGKGTAKPGPASEKQFQETWGYHKYMEVLDTSCRTNTAVVNNFERLDYIMFATDDEPKHSLLAVYTQAETEEKAPVLVELLRKGIKILLFTDTEVVRIPKELTTFQSSRLFQHYKVSERTSQRLSGLFITDGSIQSEKQLLFSQISRECPEFNEEQYAVEHAPPESHLCVEAGAGTGKTTVMIDRILFLIHMTSVPVSALTMITFTREAAQNMFHKLRRAFFQRFQATGAVRYLKLMEELCFMRISTIHSFARELIRELGSELGYGQNMQIRSFNTERKQIIERQIDAKASQWLDQHTIKEKFKEIPLHRMISITDAFWMEMERKGLTREETARIVWGEAKGDSADLHDLFIDLFANCEDEFHQLKTEANAVSLSDLTRQVELVSRREEAFINTAKQISYLFIDEFQDTDDAQIRLAARLVKALKLKLFVVGDIKQSIYRFRGADYTAFDNLRRLMAEQSEALHAFSLRKNYRSAVSILNDMDRLFSAWGGAEYLTYRSSDRLVGMRESTEAAVEIYQVNYKRYDENQRQYTIDLIRRAQETVKLSGEDKIAVLVRTNAQAGRLKAWCDDAGLNTHLEIGGTFFTSSAIQDFAYLIDALLFVKSPSALVNLLNSPYSKTNVHWSSLIPFDGNEAELMEFLEHIEPFSGWKNIQENLRIQPVLSVIRRILDVSNPAMRFMQEQLNLLEAQRPENPENKKESETRAMQYQKNLNHLLELLHQQFSTDFLSLYSLHTWLHMNIAVNREEDEPELDEEEKGNRVRIITVHKSKGLEFHTVILPFTEQVFRYGRSELLLDRRSGSWTAGWNIKENEKIFSSEFYAELNSGETVEVEREEARLLYVAMTRSEERLWIVQNKKYSNQDNWSKLLGMQGDKK
ncbi:ATP-dependent helicase [Paenibacillus sp. FSL R7-0652]|uniref:UvrD-helicase domain-containing protein n=1 Tax=Paenibacillus sp. FSL R7-0652 TaxID=2921687 RepID=UPI003159F3BE